MYTETNMNKYHYRPHAIMVLIIYTCLLAYWMLWGFGRATQPVYMYNLVPFKTIEHFLRIDHFNTRTWVINLIGNIGVFVPFGIMIPMVFNSKLVKTIYIALIGLLVLETAQLLTRKGTLDVDDFMLNSVGVAIGYMFYILCLKKVKRSL